MTGHITKGGSNMIGGILKTNILGRLVISSNRKIPTRCGVAFICGCCGMAFIVEVVVWNSFAEIVIWHSFVYVVVCHSFADIVV